MKKIYFILLLSWVILFSSCEKGKYTVIEHKLSETEKNIIPYKKGNEISGTDVQGKTVILNVIENKLDWWKTESQSWDQDHGWHLSEITKHQYNEVILEAKHSALGFNLYNRAPEGILTITFYPYGYRQQFFYDSEGNFTTKDGQLVYDSLQIDNHTYFDVAANDGFYYNKTYGVLQIKDKENNTLFKLIP